MVQDRDSRTGRSTDFFVRDFLVSIGPGAWIPSLGYFKSGKTHLPRRGWKLFQIDFFFASGTSLFLTNNDPTSNAKFMENMTTWKFVLKNNYRTRLDREVGTIPSLGPWTVGEKFQTCFSGSPFSSVPTFSSPQIPHVVLSKCFIGMPSSLKYPMVDAILSVHMSATSLVITPK